MQDAFQQQKSLMAHRASKDGTHVEGGSESKLSKIPSKSRLSNAYCVQHTVGDDHMRQSSINIEINQNSASTIREKDGKKRKTVTIESYEKLNKS